MKMQEEKLLYLPFSLVYWWWANKLFLLFIGIILVYGVIMPNYLGEENMSYEKIQLTLMNINLQAF